jgi:hypothetical protein
MKKIFAEIVFVGLCFCSYSQIGNFELNFTSNPGIEAGSYNPKHPKNYFNYSSSNQNIEFSSHRKEISYGKYGAYPYWFSVNEFQPDNVQFECEIVINEVLKDQWGTNATFLLSSDVYDEREGGMFNESYKLNAFGFTLQSSNDNVTKDAPNAILNAFNNGKSYIDWNNISKVLPLNKKLLFKVLKNGASLKLEIYADGTIFDELTYSISDVTFNYSFKKFLYLCGNGGVEYSSNYPLVKGTLDNLKITSGTTSENLVASYRFNGNADDESTNSLNGTVKNIDFVQDRFGESNSAAFFNGSNSGNVVPRNTLLDFTTFTTCFWIKPSEGYGGSIGTSYPIITRWGQGGVGKAMYDIQIQNDGKIRVVFHTGTTNCEYVSEKSVSANDWHFITVSRDENKDLSIYIDDKLDKTFENTCNPNSYSTYDLGFGHCANCSNSARYKGVLDDIKIYNRSLSEQEITNLYFENGWTGEIENNLVLSLPFSGNTNDESVNKNNAVNHGATLGTDRFGNPDAAYQFSGSNQYMSIPNISAYNTANLSISCWIYANQPITNTKGIIYKASDTGTLNREFGLSIGDSNGNANLWLETSSSSQLKALLSKPEISSGKWYHFVGVISDNDKMQIYIDGKLDNEISIDFAHVKNSTEIVIGKVSSSSQSNRYWNGKIDDVKIYNTTLSAQQISNLYLEKGWSGTSGGEFTFVDNAQPFIKQTISENSKSYFYYYINENDQTPPEGTSFEFGIETANSTIPAGGKYLGDGILQFWFNLDENINQSNLQISIPNEISHNGNNFIFNNVPQSFNIPIQKFPLEQDIEVFSGLSAGGRLLGGGAGVVVSAAAASVSISGTGGMGINFRKDSNGKEYISRRFEAGVGVEAKAPSFNSGVGNIEAGINAGVMVKGLISQTMNFTQSDIGVSDEIIKKAKALYMLETYSLGGIEMSPFTGVFIKALEKSLVSLNPDLNSVYDDMNYSSGFGIGVEGNLSLGFSASLTKSNKENYLGLDILDVGGYLALSGGYQNYNNTNFSSINFTCARGFEISALKLNLIHNNTSGSTNEFNLGSLLNASVGSEFSVNAMFDEKFRFNSLELSISAEPSVSPSITTFAESYSLSMNLPNRTINNNLEQDNIVGSLAPVFITDLASRRLILAPNYFAENIMSMFQQNPDNGLNIEEHAILTYSRQSLKGFEFSPHIALDVVVGAGAGLSLGLQLSYFDKMVQPYEQYTLAKGMILPMTSYNKINHEDRLFSFKTETQELLEGTSYLIKDALISLIGIVEDVIEAGKDFYLAVADSTCKIYGKAEEKIKIIIRKVNPTVKSVQKSAFQEPKVVNAYSSRRVIHVGNKSANISEEEETTLYIVSDNYNVNIFDENDKLLLTFEPLHLSIAIENEKLNELGFGEEEKKLAKMYYYDDDSLFWIELGEDINPHIDTITSSISRSGNYAVGIELRPSDDKTAPDIQDHYPKNGENIEQVTNFWAKLYESSTGVGIDFSKTVIKIDNIEVDAVWNPVENIISFVTVDSLSIGEHTFEVIVKDYNGNTNSAKSTVNVSYSTGINSLENIVRFDCYPVPMNDFLNIEINSKTSAPISVSIYNQIGQLVSNTFECQPVNEYIKVQWDRTGINYQRVKSGIYFVRIKQDDNIMVKKIVLD